MNSPQYRNARQSDIAAIAVLRAMEWGQRGYWEQRIAGYMNGTHNPQKARPTRTLILAELDNAAIGFIAGHLTERYECDGELEWINVLPEYRGQEVSAQLLRRLWQWFLEEKAFKICVNVDPNNAAGRKFYAKHGATDLSAHWMIWQDIRQSMLL